MEVGFIYLLAAVALLGGGVYLGVQIMAGRVRVLEAENRGLKAAVAQGADAAEAVAGVLDELRALDNVPPGRDGIRLLLDPDGPDPPESGAPVA